MILINIEGAHKLDFFKDYQNHKDYCKRTVFF